MISWRSGAEQNGAGNDVLVDQSWRPVGEVEDTQKSKARTTAPSRLLLFPSVVPPSGRSRAVARALVFVGRSLGLDAQLSRLVPRTGIVRLGRSLRCAGDRPPASSLWAVAQPAAFVLVSLRRVWACGRVGAHPRRSLWFFFWVLFFVSVLANRHAI